MSVHKNLTGADLHEPKGADTALSGQVYVSDGAGSGSWVAASSVITNSAFSTGDLKITHKSVVDTGWIFWGEGTIGDGSSGATLRANADTVDLFTLYWTINYSGLSISGGRGASAAADYASHKTLRLPPGIGRALTVTTGAVPRTIGETTGAESVVLAANQLPTHTSVNAAQSISVGSTGDVLITGLHNDTILTVPVPSSGSLQAPYNASGHGWPTVAALTGSNSISTTYTNASPTPVSLYQPTAFVNVMIKL